MYRSQRHFQNLGMFFCLLVILSACSQSVNNKTTARSSTPTSTPAPTEATQTCPAPATARAAVMPSMSAGKHPSLVYFAHGNKSDTLLRYDMTTASTIALFQKAQIVKANVSPDGRWILFITQTQSRSALQLIRIDGQQLQTLYCAPAGSIDSALFSPDQHSLLFSQIIYQQDNYGREKESSSLYLLDVRTGKLRVEASKFPIEAASSSLTSPSMMQRPQQAGGFLLSSTASMKESLKHQPLYPSDTRLPDSGGITLGFRPWRWANSTSVYLLGFPVPGLSPGGPPDLYLLHDTGQDVSRQKSNIQRIGYLPDEGVCTDNDVTPDNRQLICSHNPYLGFPELPATIDLRPLTGGTVHSIYRDPGGEVSVRAISNSVLLFTRWHAGSRETLWKINIDGSGAIQLMVDPSKDDEGWLQFPGDGQLWSFVSRDSQYYVLQAHEGLVIGSLVGGKTRPIVMQQDVKPVGWSQV